MEQKFQSTSREAGMGDAAIEVTIPSPAYVAHFSVGESSMLRTGTSTQVRGLKSVLLGATLALCCIASADAAQPTTTTTTTILLKIAGITGTSQIPGHVGEIILSGFSTMDTSAPPPSSAGGGGAGKPVCGQVTITKTIDQTSPQFLGLLFTGVSTPSATVTFQSSDGKTTPSDFYTVDLREIFVTSVAQTDFQADKVTETIVLQARVFQFRFFPSNGTPVVFGWDCVAVQKL
jgi:type VI secretion system secreted protein Hcp